MEPPAALPSRLMQPQAADAAAACVPDASAPRLRYPERWQDHGSATHPPPQVLPAPASAAAECCARCAAEPTESLDRRAALRIAEAPPLHAAAARSERARAAALDDRRSADRKRARRAQSVRYVRSPRRATDRPYCRTRAGHIASRGARAGSEAVNPMLGRPSALQLAVTRLAPFAAVARRSRGAARHRPVPAPTSPQQRQAKPTPHRVRSCVSRHSPLVLLWGEPRRGRCRNSGKEAIAPPQRPPFHGFSNYFR